MAYWIHSAKVRHGSRIRLIPKAGGLSHRVSQPRPPEGIQYLLHAQRHGATLGPILTLVAATVCSSKSNIVGLFHMAYCRFKLSSGVFRFANHVPGTYHGFLPQNRLRT
ncbi:uncharacterized protein K444DRAFT_277729 [Hyaloscypha bicolor E]|uniref:Uncharacterized protein n=1 Tax=Hyaloscypha bicolor E TaxID=1095630 RepID=A0A2J6SJC1_9HELO|nr:uncharacterized protein K444DRAFT_277729 [Hyaloscypha bicolor E]PMD50857.1 hypothetical protein K444DRAFT_277729 [Hyaloscypha bicolor E]